MTNSDPDSALTAYRGGAHESFTAPPPETIVARARRRTRNRAVAAAAAILVVSLGGAVAVATLGPGTDDNPPAVNPSPTTTGTPSPPPPSPPPPSPPASAPSSAPPASTPSRSTSSGPPSIDVRGVDWENTTIRFPARRDDDDCLTGPVRITDGLGGPGGDRPHVWVRAAYDEGRATFGDLNGDGRADAVIYASCAAGLGDEDSSGQVLVVTGRTGQLVAHWVGPVAAVIDDVAIAGGRLTITFTVKYAEPEVAQQRTYRWNGTRFVRA